jgi:DNA helicase-2/ATP-dependent DNA helicase PcrA
VEFELKNVELEGIPLKGVIDKIEYLEQNTLRIVDYKTGAYDKKRVALPSEDNPIGGDYYRQLLFYKVLVEQSHLFSETVAKGLISWIEPNAKRNLVYDEMAFSKEDSTWMRQLITETYANIRQLKFDTGCGEPDCAWCRMTREHALPDLIPKPEDGLDD